MSIERLLANPTQARMAISNRACFRPLDARAIHLRGASNQGKENSLSLYWLEGVVFIRTSDAAASQKTSPNSGSH